MFKILNSIWARTQAVLAASRIPAILKSFVDLRVLILILPALAVLFSVRPVAQSLLYSMCGMLVIAGLSHWVRKVALPYTDMEEFAEIAKREPLAAALVFLSISLLLCTLIIGTVLWVRG